MSLRHLALFNGIGGFQLAAQWVGWENVASVEIKDICNIKTKKHFPKCIQYGDIRTTDFAIWRGKIDIITGGFPCQDISHVNTKAKGIEGEKSSLWKEYARAIGEIRPKYIVIENSPMLVSRGLNQLLSDLARMGYDAEWRYFYAAEAGFPTYRKRLFIISYPVSIRPESFIIEGIELQKNISQFRENEALDLPLPLIRFHSGSDFDNVHLDNGFSKELDKDSIEELGNAIVPQIAFEIFKAIEATISK